MSKITDIKPQQKNKDRVNIYLDNKFFCGMQLETVVKNQLNIDDEIEPKQLENLIFDSEKLSAFDKCAKVLNSKMKTQKEMQDYLYEKGYTEQVVEYCINKLLEYKYLSDENYVDCFVKHNSYKYGKSMIKNKLLSRGIDKLIIENYFMEFSSSKQEINELYNKFMKNKLNTQETIQTAIKRLIGRGFSYDEIKESINISEE